MRRLTETDELARGLDAPDLEARQGNPNLFVRQLTIDRGLIYAADGKTVFAKNRKVRKKSVGRTWYLRTYPTGELAAHWPEANGLLPHAFGRAPERSALLELDKVGMDEFNAVWTGPETLPSKAEITDHAAWMARVL